MNSIMLQLNMPFRDKPTTFAFEKSTATFLTLDNRSKFHCSRLNEKLHRNLIQIKSNDYAR